MEQITPSAMHFVRRGPRRKQPRLLERRYADHSVWIIRFDGQREISTGCIVSVEDEQARLRLAEFIISQTVKDVSERDYKKLQINILLTEYKNSIGIPGIAPPAQRAALNARIWRIDKLMEFFGKKTIGDCKLSDSWDYVAWRTKQRVKNQSENIADSDIRYVSWNTARDELSEFDRAMSTLAKRYGFPMPALARLKREHKPRIGLTRHEVYRLLYACRGHQWDPIAQDWQRELVADPATGEMMPNGRIITRDADRLPRKALARFILIGLRTGTRHSAILGLRWRQSSRDGSIDVVRGVLRRKGTGERMTTKRRTSAMLSAVMLRDVRNWHRADTAAGIVSVIHKSDGQPYRTSFQKQFADVVIDAGLDPAKVTPHVLRHTIVHWLLDRAASIHSIAALIGCTVETLMRWYGKETYEGQKNAIDCLNDREGMRKVGVKRGDPTDEDPDVG